MKCSCGKDMVPISEHQDPKIAAGHKTWECNECKSVETSSWYCPYIPVFKD